MSNHNATAYSDGKTGTISDSWDTQGIYQKKDFELTTMEVQDPKKETSLV